MTRKKKVKIFLIVVVVLYICSASFGLTRDDGEMGKAMTEVRRTVGKAREEIKKEMEKPFILRLFGSLFGMENNSFQKLKEELPETLKSAMPKTVLNFSFTAPSTGVACEGMRLADALLYLRERELPLEEVAWSLDDEVEDERYIKLGGTVLQAEQSESGRARLLIQLFHDFSGEDGLGENAEQRRENLELLRAEAAKQRTVNPKLVEWLEREDNQKIQDAVAKGFPLATWQARPVSFEPLAPAAEDKQ